MAGGQGFAQAGPFPVGTGEAVVDVDPLLVDAKVDERDALGCEVLVGGRDAGLADQEFARPFRVFVATPLTGRYCGRVLRESALGALRGLLGLAGSFSLAGRLTKP